LVLYLVNSNIVNESDFYRSSEGEQRGGCFLRDAARKTFLKHFEQKMASPIVHPGTGESVDWRRAMDLQVAHLLQRIRGEVSAYLPLEIR
jgi:CRISPR-associated protein Cas1